MSKGTKDPKTTNKKYQSGYVSVNGLDMYYEIHGKGVQPLVLVARRVLGDRHLVWKDAAGTRENAPGYCVRAAGAWSHRGH